MAGVELFGAEERKEVNDVMETAILFRYNHDQQRNGIWKAKEFEAEVKKITGAKFAHAVSSGSTAVATALAAAGIGAGDEVIVPVPYWVSFKDIVRYAGGNCVLLETDENQGFRLTAEMIERLVTPRTKLIILNSPSNPSGAARVPGSKDCA